MQLKTMMSPSEVASELIVSPSEVALGLGGQVGQDKKKHLGSGEKASL